MINGVPQQFEDINEDVNNQFSDASFERSTSDTENPQVQPTNATRAAGVAIVPVNENHIQSYSNIDAGQRPKTLSVGLPISNEASTNSSGTWVSTFESSGARGSRTGSDPSQQKIPRCILR